MFSTQSPYFDSKWRIAGQVSIIIIIISLPLYILVSQPWNKKETTNKAHFVGKESCIECHETEYHQWQGSHHDKAMAIASDSSILGNFDNFKFTHKGETHTFFKKENKFYVNTVGSKGTFEDFEITHTFGYVPLQQYLIPFENGKFQCLPIAWDSDRNSWFHLGDTIYPDENLTPDNWLFWTNQAQNWNGMCADCHSTNLQKNYNHETNSYNTTYSEINVSCEACHGPASEHIKWAALPEGARPNNINTGLVIKTSGINNEHFVNNCARCHSRRSVMCDFQNETTELLNQIIPEKPVMPNYHHDGQILNEDYVYTSFTQSKMFTKDVQCNDCHNSHSLELKSRKNDLCLQCHQPVLYDTPDHHFHKMPGDNYDKMAANTSKPNYEDGEGARCVNCHMDGDFYMGNDYRRDHSFRIPRPDLTMSIGTPNACNKCHSDKSAQWAQNYIKEWYGKKKRPHYGTTFEAASRGELSALPELIEYANNEVYPLMVRAAAIELMSNYNTTKSTLALETLLTDPNSIIRHTAAESYSPTNIESFIKNLEPLLSDRTKAIRSAVAYRLSEVPNNNFDKKLNDKINKGLKEYEEINLYMADFPGSLYNLGNLHFNKQNTKKAQEFYEASLKADNQFFMAKTNLAMVYNMQGNNKKAEHLFLELISEQPHIPDFNYSLALLYAEMGNLQSAKTYLIKTVEIAPENTRAWYNLALVQSNLNNLEEAERCYLQAVKLEPENFNYLWATAIHYLNTNKSKELKTYVSIMDNLFPGNDQVEQLKGQVGM